MQITVVIVGISVLVFLLVEPHFEGVNTHRTVAEIYLHDPFLAYVYLGSIAFFVALYRSFRLFGCVRQSIEPPTPTMLAALLSIKRCGYLLLGFEIGAIFFIIQFGDAEDRPAGFMMCLLAAIVSGGIALLAAWCARKILRTLPYTRL